MTKNNPGKFNCYEKAAPDEPLFTLRAKDQVAAAFVRAWRLVRAGEIDDAMDQIEDAFEALKQSGRPLLPLGSDKSKEAEECAAAMEAWCRAERKIA